MKLVILWLQTPVNAVIHGKKKLKCFFLRTLSRGGLSKGHQIKGISKPATKKFSGKSIFLNFLENSWENN